MFKMSSSSSSSSNPRSRMYLNTKRNVDNLASKCILSQPAVLLKRLTQEDIDQYKLLDFNDEKCCVPNAKKRLIEEDEKITKKTKLEDEKGTAVLKLVLSREGETEKFKSKFKSTLNIENDNASTSTAEKSACEGITEPTKSTNSMIGTIRVRDPSTMVYDMARYNSMFRDKKLPKAQTQRSSSIKKYIMPGNYTHNVYTTARGNLSLTEIEELYKKYFSKSVQDSIVIIANIVYIISLSNKHYKSRTNESFKKRTEAEKLKERCDANKIHMRHKKVLEEKLKTNFNNVIEIFSKKDFEPSFQMFFLSILTVVRVLDQPKFKRGSIFRNVVILLRNSLKSCKFEHPRIFNMFQSEAFRHDCTDLISLIEDIRDNDPSITDRMSLFFISSVSSKDCFQGVINAITSDSVEDLGQLIKNAEYQLRSCSSFKEPHNFPSSIAKQPPQETNNDQSKVISDMNLSFGEKPPPQWVIAKGPNGLYQPISLVNKAQKPSESTSKPPNAFYKTLSNSLITKSSTESVNSKVITPKVSIVTTTTSVAGGPPRGTPTIVTFKPSIHDMRPLPTPTIQRPKGNTIYNGGTKYQVVKAPARTHQNSNNNVVFKTQRKIVDITPLCYAENCKVLATIMCSICKSVKYCSIDCQRLDWYASHVNNCDRLRGKYNSL